MQRKLTLLRVTAYGLAVCFMIVMVVRGVWITRNQMEAEVDRSVAAAATLSEAMARAGSIDRLEVLAALNALAPAGVTYRSHALSAGPAGTGTGPGTGSATPGEVTEVRTVTTAGGKLRLMASIDHAAIWDRALRANLPFMLFVLALGLPTVVIFLYMGWLVNRPALLLLGFAQSGGDEDRHPPQLPGIWHSVLARLQELRGSRKQMQAFLDHAPIGMMFRHPTGKLIMINRYGASFYDMSADELTAQPISFFNVYFPDSKALAHPLFLDPLGGADTTVETEFHAPSGKIMNMLIKSFPVIDSEGKVGLVGNFFVDVTEERRARADLVESRASLQAFFDNLPGLAFLESLEGRIITANAYLADHFGLTQMRAEYLKGKSGAKLLPTSWSQHAKDAVTANQQDGKPYSFQTTIDLPDGQRHVSATRFPIRDADGKIIHVGGLVFDRTQEVAAAAEIAASRESLLQSEKLAAFGSMLAGVSHELNNPLAAVIGQTALLAEDLEGSEHAGRIAKIRRAADRCARIVQSFLAMARQKLPEYRSVNINDQVRSAVDLTEYQLHAANVVLDLRLDDALPEIEADPDQLHQVIANLLTNARQALETVSGERRITITTSRAGNGIRLSLADTGKGIDPTTRDRIFDPYFTTKSIGAGTGIGLSYSRGVIEAHGGTIGIEDAPIGTNFVVTLPFSRAAPAAALPISAATPALQGRALIIDDEPDVAEMLADMLSRMGIETTVAIGGVAGQAAMTGGAPYDFLLSDIRMPDLDGPALHAWIKTNRPDLVGRIAFVTGDTLSGIAADFLDGAQCPFLEKPFTPAALRTLVADMLRPSQQPA
ncbi:ATP-binding protein [Sandarakinorhabdus sp.]|uniref:ATP-binding protein n=1 Tax=Sandarakinorhabdus sp. TaxID=1916663 RepID=UPI0033402ED4